MVLIVSVTNSIYHLDSQLVIQLGRVQAQIIELVLMVLTVNVTNSVYYPDSQLVIQLGRVQAQIIGLVLHLAPYTGRAFYNMHVTPAQLMRPGIG